MKKGASVILTAMLIGFFVACRDQEKVLIGTWTTSSYVSPAELAKLAKESLPEGVSAEGSASGSKTYHVDYKYNEEGEFNFRLNRGGEERVLRFFVREAGIWKIQGDVLVETSEDSSMTPIDDFTKEAVEKIPTLKAVISPAKGKTTSYTLKNISDSKILLEEKESGETIILQRTG